ncbi:MAG: hypothetical protein IJE89_03305 [Bacilli bacterium]|nr:hypothetical protein [Bacilli bacterium]
MIFDEYFDRALWLMLQGNKKSRDILINFVNSLTDEMYEILRKISKEYYSDASIVASYYEHFGNKYDLSIKYKSNYLTIVLKKYTDSKKDKLDESYEVSLYSILNNFIGNNSPLKKTTIGSVDYKKSKEKSNVESCGKKTTFLRTNYEFSYNFKRCLLETRDLLDFCLFTPKRVNLEQMPSDIYSSCILNDKNENIMTKKRKK